jgi:hypothetical protein
MGWQFSYAEPQALKLNQPCSCLFSARTAGVWQNNLSCNVQNGEKFLLEPPRHKLPLFVLSAWPNGLGYMPSGFTASRVR